MSEVLQWIGEMLGTEVTVANITGIATSVFTVVFAILFSRAKAKANTVTVQVEQKDSQIALLETKVNTLTNVVAGLAQMTNTAFSNSKLAPEAKALIENEYSEVKSALSQAGIQFKNMADIALNTAKDMAISTAKNMATTIAQPLVNQVKESAKTVFDTLREQVDNIPKIGG